MCVIAFIILYMSKLKQYIEEITGETMNPTPVRASQFGRLPLYLTEGYRFFDAKLMQQDLLLVFPKMVDRISILQLSKHNKILRNTVGKPVVFVFDNIEAFNRKRLIEKHLNFIVPDKQLFIPELFIDLRESYNRPKTQREQEKLLPTAQFLLLYHLLHRNDNNSIEHYAFKDLAKKLGYTPMAISKAVGNLKSHDLISVEGSKEKRIVFNRERTELWHFVNNEKLLLISPVLRRVYVDELPKQAVLKTNTSALPEYTDMNPSRQQFYAIEKTLFYALQRNNELVNLNEYEGEYCLELWKYNPISLMEGLDLDRSVVDPLSLYLSLKDEHDERIEMALDQIIENYIW